MGTPEEVVAMEGSSTGHYLNGMLFRKKVAR